MSEKKKNIVKDFAKMTAFSLLAEMSKKALPEINKYVQSKVLCKVRVQCDWIFNANKAIGFDHNDRAFIKLRNDDLYKYTNGRLEYDPSKKDQYYLCYRWSALGNFASNIITDYGFPILIKLDATNRKASRKDDVWEECQNTPNTRFIYLITLNTQAGRDSIDRLVKDICKKSKEIIVDKRDPRNDVDPDKHMIEAFASSDGGDMMGMNPWINLSYKQLRGWNNVFLENDKKEQITKSIDAFIKDHDYYKEHNLKYHYGLLLYGEPGTGKSSIVQAISKEFNLPIHVYGAADITSFDQEYYEMDRLRIILIEDVDTATFSGTRNKQTNTDSNDNIDLRTRVSNRNLGKILNTMDGLTALENVIYIFTTNHIEQLDPALIRPGRCDLHIEVNYVNKETLNQFFKCYFNKTYDMTDVELKSGITFAELQQQLMLKTNPDVIFKSCIKVD